MVVTFVGHREISEEPKVRRWLEETVSELIHEGADTFYLGGYGQFDRLAASVVWAEKARNPQICSYLVIPYPDRSYDTAQYDGTVYPPLESVPRRYAIAKRNEYMIQTSWLPTCAILSAALLRRSAMRNRGKSGLFASLQLRSAQMVRHNYLWLTYLGNSKAPGRNKSPDTLFSSILHIQSHRADLADHFFPIHIAAGKGLLDSRAEGDGRFSLWLISLCQLHRLPAADAPLSGIVVKLHYQPHKLFCLMHRQLYADLCELLRHMIDTFCRAEIADPILFP